MQTFETARLVMRLLGHDDEALYCACYIDPVLMQHIGEPLTHDAALRSFAAALKSTTAIPIRRYTWVMQEKQSQSKIGLLALVFSQDQDQEQDISAELGHIVLTKFQNQGLTVEAITGMLDIAFHTTRLATVFVNHKSKNNAVTRVVKKLGFLPDTVEPGDISNCRWALPRSHWQSTKASRDLKSFAASAQAAVQK